MLTCEDVLVTARNTVAALARQVETESTYVEIEPDEPPPSEPPAAESRYGAEAIPMEPPRRATSRYYDAKGRSEPTMRL